MSKHTRGPWHWVAWKSKIEIRGEAEWGIAYLDSRNQVAGAIPDQQCKADAALIAAAPAMYETLQDVLKVLDQMETEDALRCVRDIVRVTLLEAERA